MVQHQTRMINKQSGHTPGEKKVGHAISSGIIHVFQTWPNYSPRCYNIENAICCVLANNHA